MSDSPEPRDLAAAYHHSHPGLPAGAAAWLTGPEPLNVLELGAGTGIITAELIRLGHRVYASDASPELLKALSQRLPDVPVRLAEGPQIEAGDKIFDLVVVPVTARFDLAAALPEIARVLVPGGHLALVSLQRDPRIPWVRRLGDLLAEPAAPDPHTTLAASPHFGWVEETSEKFWQAVDRAVLQDLALAGRIPGHRPEGPTTRQVSEDDLLAEVASFYDDFGRGHDGMQLPWISTCFRTQVAQQPVSPPEPAAEPATDETQVRAPGHDPGKDQPGHAGGSAESPAEEGGDATAEQGPSEPTAAAQDSFETLRTDTVEIARISTATFDLTGSGSTQGVRGIITGPGSSDRDSTDQDSTQETSAEERSAGPAKRTPRDDDGPDTEMLLIDFN